MTVGQLAGRTRIKLLCALGTCLLVAVMLQAGLPFDSPASAQPEPERQEGRWEPAADLNDPSKGKSVLLPDGKVLRVGLALLRITAEIYDPAKNEWTTVAPPPYPGLSAVPQFLLLLEGSQDECGQLCGKVLVKFRGGPIPPYWIYDPVTGGWVPTPTRPEDDHAYRANAIVLKGPNCGDNCGKVLLLGGWYDANPYGYAYRDQRTLRATELFDPKTGLWKRVTETTYNYWGAHLALMSNGRVLATRGRVRPTGPEPLEPFSPALGPVSEVFDPITERWSPTEPGNFECQNLTALPGTGAIATVCQAGQTHIYDLAHVYDMDSNSWRPGQQCMECKGTAVLLPSGKVLVAAGRFPTEIPRAHVYDPQKERWSFAGQPSSLRHGDEDSGSSYTVLEGSEKQCGENCGKVLVAGYSSAPGDKTSELYTSKPQITGIEPNIGPASGKQTVAVKGTGLTQASSVSFEGSPPLLCGEPEKSPCWTDSVDPDRSITAITPVSPDQNVIKIVPVTVTTPAGASQPAVPGADLYTYVPIAVIDSLAPNCGPVAGGTDVKIEGKHLLGNGAEPQVLFGSRPARVIEKSDESLMVKSPAAAGPQVAKVSVQTEGGLSVSAGLFSYPCPPSPPVLPPEDPAEGLARVELNIEEAALPSAFDSQNLNAVAAPPGGTGPPSAPSAGPVSVPSGAPGALSGTLSASQSASLGAAQPLSVEAAAPLPSGSGPGELAPMAIPAAYGATLGEDAPGSAPQFLMTGLDAAPGVALGLGTLLALGFSVPLMRTFRRSPCTGQTPAAAYSRAV